MPIDNAGHGAVDLTHRFQWVSPLMLSPHNPDILYTAAECVFKSTDHGQSWTQISGDLTRNDKSKQQPSGGPLTNDITSVEYYDTVFALAESPVNKGTLWAGTDDGLVHVTTDDGQHWSKVTPKTPDWSTVSIIDASPHDGNTAYVAVDRHKLDDFKPYIFKTTDLGKNWSAITNGIPDGAYVHAVRVDPRRQGLLYAGTELGVFMSFDDGVHWQPLQLNLPVTPIHDLVVKDDDLVAATHGRSFWVLDDLTPLRQANAQSAAADVILYQPQTAVRLHYPEEFDKRQPIGDNPPPGAIIDYYFRTAPKEEVTLDITSQIENLHKRFGDDTRLKAALAAADDLNRKMSEIEQKLIQVNMKGSEANLAFPNMLNERFDTFSHTIETADTEPTAPQLDVFQMLSSQLDEQLKKWAALKQEDIARVSELVKQANLPALIIVEKK